MVSGRRLKRSEFRRSECGVTLVEGLITFPIVLLVIAAMVEFGFAVFQWNQTVKAMQLGARLAAVSEPLTDLSPITDFYDAGGVPIGQPPPAGAPSVACGAGTTTCDATQIQRLVFGSDGDCDPDYAAGGVWTLPGMCDFNPRIRPENVLVTYAPSGLGYVGRPGLPVVTVAVETRNLTFQLPFLGALLGINTIEIPAHPVTVTSEDLSNSVP